MEGPFLPQSATDPEVLEFLRLWGLRDPFYLDHEDVGEGYEKDFCHVSAKHIALKRGGRRLHGWALWKFTEGGVDVIVADFHSVWQDPDGKIVDVTPPKAGGRVLFVPDSALAISRRGSIQYLHSNRTSVVDMPRLWNGQPTEQEFFGVPDDLPALLKYCEKLGLPDTSME